MALAPRRLPAEFEPQSAIALIWPTETSGWPLAELSQIQAAYRSFLGTLSRYSWPVLLNPHADDPQLAIACNDTWLRDTSPVFVEEGEHWMLHDFRFAGWGGKFPASVDDQIAAHLAERLFPHTPRTRWEHELEGGAIESDGRGTLLAPRAYWQKRGWAHEAEVEAFLAIAFGIDRVLWLDAGYIEGDDTDGHIDMLARFASPQDIVFQGCQEPTDAHFSGLCALREQLGALRTRDDEPYRLHELPLPAPIHDDERRLPASYANFVILNEAVIVPTYADAADAAALAAIGRAFPSREIAGHDARAFIRQGGSLHCSTQHIPAGIPWKKHSAPH